MNENCKKELSNHINLEISKRNIPSTNIQPYLSVHPVSTKYQIYPCLNERKESNVPLEQYSTFNSKITFNPANKQSPNWCNYINIESELRNQNYGLTKGGNHIFIPNSNSDLYFYKFEEQSMNNDLYNPHKNLFKNENFQPFNPNINNLGYQLFYNNTRIQMKEIQN
jgi:hypothetical protein